MFKARCALAVACLATLAAASAADASIQRYEHNYQLSDRRQFKLRGTPTADGACVMPGGSMSLAPDQRAVEVREVEFDTDTCVATMEEGVPPASTLDETGTSGSDSASGSAPDRRGPTATAARRRRRLRAVAAATYRSAGYVSTWYEDPVNINVNLVRAKIDYYYNFSCTWGNLATWQEEWYTTSGWSRIGHDFQYADRCDLAASSVYAQFLNGVFCAGGNVWTTYDRTSIHGHKDGSLWAYWASSTSGAICRNLLSLNRKLVRTV
jgi:hypothetical protein